MPPRTILQRVAGAAGGRAGAVAAALLSFARGGPEDSPRQETRDVAPAVPSARQVSPAAPGLGPRFQSPRSQSEAAQLLPLYEALFGKTTFRVGPNNPRWSTFSGEMDPESITGAIDLANTGQPFLYMDMCRRAAENDAAIGASCELAFSSIVAEEDRIEPRASMRRYKLAISLANWLRAVREQVQDFDRARYALLWAEGVSYSAAENIFGNRTITWFDADGKRHHRSYVVPVKLEIVDGRAFRFDMETDDPLLWIDGDHAPLPPAKFIFHTAYSFSSLRERGGFMRSCLYLHMAKQAFLRDMSIYGHEYGLQQMVAEYDRTLYSYEEAKETIRTALANKGEGGVPTVPMGAMDLRNDAPPVQGELVHGQAAQLLNAEIFRRITLGLLTMTDSGGSYGLGDIHARGAFAGAKLRAHNLCGSISRGCWAPTFGLNALRLAVDLGYSPSEIMAAQPDYRVRLLQDDSPERRQKVFSQAARDRVEFSKQQYRAELHLDEPRDEEDVVRGEVEAVASGAALRSPLETGEGTPGASGAQSGAGGSASGGSGGSGGAGVPAVELTATAQAAVITVDEARGQMQLGPWRNPAEGRMTVAEFMAKNSGTIAEAAHAEAGGDEAAAAGARRAFQRSASEDPSVMVALYPPPELAAELALQGGEAPQELHVTLAYLGRRSELAAPLDRLAKALRLVRSAPLSGTLGGVGRFSASASTDGQDVVYASVDVPGLEDVRQALLAALDLAGAAPAAAHGFVPHLTLAYVDPAAPSPLQRLEPRPIRFTDIYLVAGEERTAFPLKESV